jgi:hypothetical protein
MALPVMEFQDQGYKIRKITSDTYMVSIQIFFFRKLYIKKRQQFQTILFPYKNCVIEKKTYVGYQIEIPSLLTVVVLAIPFNKLPRS